MFQKLFQVEFITEQSFIIPRFLPIMNASQLKAWQLNEFHEEYDYLKLEDLNESDYELSGFFVIFDDKNLPHQIAIFTNYRPITTD